MALNYNEWRQGEAQRRAAVLPFARRAETTARTRPRAEVEAEFLRRIGTPERLIGPTSA